MAKFLLVTCDTAPTKALQQLADELKNQGHEVRAFLLNAGKNEAPSDPELADAVEQADVVVCGISSEKNAELELMAADYANISSKKLGMYADSFDRWQAEHLDTVLPIADFLFVINEEEAQRAREMYPNLRVEAVGNPEWYKYFLPAGRSAARALVGAHEHECVVFVPFTKNKDVNMGKVAVVLQAVGHALPVGESYQYSGPVRMVINIHPGDKTPPSFYNDRLSALAVPRALEAVFSDKNADDLIPGADIVIGPSTAVAVHAMARMLPLADITTPAIRKWLGEESGDEHSYAVQHGGSFEVSEKGFADLTGLLVYLTESFEDPIIVGEWRERLQKQAERQKALIPRSIEGESIGRIAELLLDVRQPVTA